MTEAMPDVKALFARVDTSLLYPPFYEALQGVLEACMRRGARYVVTHGFRSFEQQRGLYVIHRKGGPRAAPEGLSAHNYGLAVDVVADADPATLAVEPAWKAPAYRVFGEETIKAGLAWGAAFGDSPHAQWPRFVSRSELLPLRNTWQLAPEAYDVKQRLALVWNLVDRQHEPH